MCCVLPALKIRRSADFRRPDRSGLHFSDGGLREVVRGAAALVTRAWSAVGAVALTAAILGVGYVSASVWLWSVRMAGGFPFAPNILLIGCLAVAYLRRDQFERFA